MSEEQALQEALAAVKAAHFDAGGTARDYGALCKSAGHVRVVQAVAGLDTLDFKRVRFAAQTAFWLNVFNAVVVRDIAELAQAESVKDVEAFFERSRVRVAGFGYSLDDIEHGLLRGNVPKFRASRTPMERDDPRLAHTPLAYDERMHFGLYSAGRSSPPLAVFDAGGLDRDLESATEQYLRREVRVEQEGALVTLPRKFYWYRDDFGGEESALAFAVARLDDASADLIDRRRGRVKVRYAEFEWRP